MKHEIGEVKEVYLLDYDENLIGFKVEINGIVIDIVEKQNLDNAKIYRGDKVVVKTDIVNKEEVKTLELLSE